MLVGYYYLGGEVSGWVQDGCHITRPASCLDSLWSLCIRRRIHFRLVLATHFLKRKQYPVALIILLILPTHITYYTRDRILVHGQAHWYARKWLGVMIYRVCYGWLGIANFISLFSFYSSLSYKLEFYVPRSLQLLPVGDAKLYYNKNTAVT